MKGVLGGLWAPRRSLSQLPAQKVAYGCRYLASVRLGHYSGVGPGGRVLRNAVKLLLEAVAGK